MMLRLMCDNTRHDMIRNENNRENWGRSYHRKYGESSA